MTSPVPFSTTVELPPPTPVSLTPFHPPRLSLKPHSYLSWPLTYTPNLSPLKTERVGPRGTGLDLRTPRVGRLAERCPTTGDPGTRVGS